MNNHYNKVEPQSIYKIIEDIDKKIEDILDDKLPESYKKLLDFKASEA